MRIQFALTRVLTRALKTLGLRESFIRARYVALRFRRKAFERFGSTRYSRPALHGMDRKLELIRQIWRGIAE